MCPQDLEKLKARWRKWTRVETANHFADSRFRALVFVAVGEWRCYAATWHRPRTLRTQRGGRALREPWELGRVAGVEVQVFRSLTACPVLRVSSCRGEEGRRHRHRQGPVNRGTKVWGGREPNVPNPNLRAVAICRPRSAPGLLRGGAAGEALHHVRRGPSRSCGQMLLRSILASSKQAVALALCSRDAVCLRRCAEPNKGNHEGTHTWSSCQSDLGSSTTAAV